MDFYIVPEDRPGNRGLVYTCLEYPQREFCNQDVACMPVFPFIDSPGTLSFLEILYLYDGLLMWGESIR